MPPLCIAQQAFLRFPWKPFHSKSSECRRMADAWRSSHLQRTFTDGRRQADAMATNAAKKVLVLCATVGGQGGHGHRSSFLQEQIKGIIIIRASWRGPLAARARPGMAQGLEKLGAKPIVAKLHREQGKITIDAAAGQDDASRRFRFPSLASLSSPSCKTSRP